MGHTKNGTKLIGFISIYQILAIEEDNVEHIGRFDLTIELINWNDEVPIFSLPLYTIQINETVPADYFLAQTLALDRDIDDSVV